MSALASRDVPGGFAHGALGASAPAPGPAPSERARIHLVPAPSQSRSRIPFVLLCMTLVAAALVTGLILNTSMARGAYEERDLESQLAQLAQGEQALLTELDELASPRLLAKQARELGMVQDPTPAFIRLSDGRIIGDPSPAGKSQK